MMRCVPRIARMLLRNKHFACLLALAAVVGLVLPAHSAVFCHRADGTRTFEWRCDAADDCNAHQQNDEAAFSPRIGGDDCHDIPARVIVGVNFHSRRESLWLPASPPLPFAAVVDGHGAAFIARCPAMPLDDRLLRSTGSGAVRTIVLQI